MLDCTWLASAKCHARKRQCCPIYHRGHLIISPSRHACGSVRSSAHRQAGDGTDPPSHPHSTLCPSLAHRGHNLGCRRQGDWGGPSWPARNSRGISAGGLAGQGPRIELPSLESRRGGGEKPQQVERPETPHSKRAISSRGMDLRCPQSSGYSGRSPGPDLGLRLTCPPVLWEKGGGEGGLYHRDFRDCQSFAHHSQL